MEPQSPASNPVPKDAVITLERTICFGNCPSYKLMIYADGVVVYEGREYVKTKGTAKGQIREEALKQLISEFERINFFSLRDTYYDQSDGCSAEVTDMPSAKTSIQVRGRKKTISHYYGCWEKGRDFVIYPQELFKLEKMIDEVVNSKQWVK
ncbi:MAG TPA: DUF6438 domain-containing protein [Nitrososphaera sp.]|nr:DUF6438 domain-containing protein [Nitrososphaera sp.]